MIKHTRMLSFRKLSLFNYILAMNFKYKKIFRPIETKILKVFCFDVVKCWLLITGHTTCVYFKKLFTLFIRD